MRNLWILFLALQPPLPQTSIFEALRLAVTEVSQEVWGIIASFFGAVYFAYEDNGWTLKRKIWVVLCGLVFGFALGYGVTKAFGLTYWSYLVYGAAGVLGFNFAGGIRTLGVKWKKDPLKTANDLNDLRRNIQKFGDDEKPIDDNDDKRSNGDNNAAGEPQRID